MDFAAGDGWISHDFAQEKKNQTFQNLGDRLPIPVALSSLTQYLSNSDDDAYKIGDYHFRTIQTVGVILEMTKEDGKVKYLLHDPENTEKTFSVTQFGSIDEGGSRFVQPDLSEDVRVRVMGKLKNLAGEKTILAFYLQKLIDDKEYEIFKLESQVAQLFFKKDLSDKMRNGDTMGWHGMLAPPIRVGSYLSPVTPKSIRSAQEPSPSSSAPATSPHTPNAIKSKIRAVVRSEANKNKLGTENTENGVPIAQILKKMEPMSEERLREILSEMEEEGMIYTAQLDEYMSMF
ncbi:unnamed protein product [Caenorhabditis sp. 36 PRJEB53466]|nr:unnamed protein product [Caenorhabditis sp. 36 PRJEB53466]